MAKYKATKEQIAKAKEKLDNTKKLSETLIKDIINNPYGLNYVVEIALPYLRIHDLRHSCVSLLVNNAKTQQSLVAMAYHFGHSVETMLNTYSHLFTETEQALIQEFDQVIENQSTSIK